MAVAQGVSSDELDSELVADVASALRTEIDTALTSTTDTSTTDDAAAAPLESGEQTEDPVTARSRELKAGGLRAHAKHTLALKARKNKDLLGLDGSPVFEGWTIGVGQKLVKPVGKPRGKAASSMSSARLEAKNAEAQERRAAARDEEPTYELCATYTCDLCSEREFAQPSVAFPDGRLLREKGEAITSFPKGLISHRTGPYSCVRNTFQSLEQLQAKRARQPRSEAGREFNARYDRSWAFAEGVPAKVSDKAAVATKPKVDGRKRKAAEAVKAATANTPTLNRFFAVCAPAPAPAAAEEPELESLSDPESEFELESEFEPEHEVAVAAAEAREQEPGAEVEGVGAEEEGAGEEEPLLVGFDDGELEDIME